MMKNQATAALAEILGSGAEVHRCAAARALGNIGDASSVNILVKALLDEDPDVRVDASIALGQIKHPQSIEALMQSLIGDPEGLVKIATLDALVAMGHNPVIPLLQKLAESRSADFGWDDDEYYSEGWDSWVDVQLAAIRGLGTLEVVEAVPTIMAALNDEMGQDVTEPGFLALKNMGEAGAKALEVLFDQGDARMNRRIAAAVSGNSDPNLAGLREKMLASPVVKVREIALRGLAPGDPTVEALLDDPDTTIRTAAVQHAGLSFPEKLHGLMLDLRPEVRAEVFKIVAANPAQFKDSETIKVIQNAIKGDPEAAKQAALALVATKGPKAAKGLTHVLGNTKIPHDFRIGVIEALQKAGHIAVPALLNAGGDEDRHLRLASLTALAELAAKDPIWPNVAGMGLLSALNGELVLPPEEVEPEADGLVLPDPDATEEEQEIEASLPLVAEEAKPATSTLELIKSGSQDTSAEPAKEVVLTEQDKRFLEISKSRAMSKKKMSLHTTVAPHLDVRRFSARLLAGVVNADATENLVAALGCDDLELVNACLFALVSHGEKIGKLPEIALEPLTSMLTSPNSDTRVLAVRAFGWLPGPEVDTVLISHLTDSDDFIRVEAVRALDHRGIANAAVVDSLRDPYLGVGIAAAASIARHNCAKETNALVEFAFSNDGTFRRDIGRMLGEHAPKEGTERLLEILADQSYRPKWLVAIDALAELFSQPGQKETLKVA